jgi:hypothetical protein
MAVRQIGNRSSIRYHHALVVALPAEPFDSNAIRF